MKKTLVTGARGQLGSEFRNLTERRSTFVFTDLVEGDGIYKLDICNYESVLAFVKEHNIGTIINCAAYTNVEEAERNERQCMKINYDGVVNLGKAAREVDAALIHISTDYVFDGKNRRGGYRENDIPRPLNVYGKSKLKSEIMLYKMGVRGVIIRTSWLYSPYGNNFVKTMYKLGKEKDEISVVMDQIGSPTYSADLAGAILKIIPKVRNKYAEVFHYSNLDPCSWQTLAAWTMVYSKSKCKVRGITSKQYPQKAKRPAYSYLNKMKFTTHFGIEIPHWKDSLKKCIRRINKQEL
ncbi:MAG: dTDP-4-dehydrorhamnose reductase [Bacteroidales bacterium]|nr:dTDP-4-dehydrorhamnose reductase [Bacteroidales bacterium]